MTTDCVLDKTPQTLYRIQPRGHADITIPPDELPPVVQWVYEVVESWPTRSGRYDSPTGAYGVSYLGTTVRAALYEVVSNLRVDHRILDRLRSVGGTSDRFRYPLRQLPRAALAAREIVQVAPASGTVCADVMNETAQVALGEVPPIRAVLNGFPAFLLRGVRLLDSGVLMAKGRHSYRICQQVSAHVHDLLVGVSGIRYISRVGQQQECWALFEGTEWRLGNRERLISYPELPLFLQAVNLGLTE